MEDRSLKTSELADLAGVNVHTVRYYESRGLLPKPPRTRSGYRMYGSEHVAHIRFIKRAQELGFTLEEIRSEERRVGKEWRSRRSRARAKHRETIATGTTRERARA